MLFTTLKITFSFRLLLVYLRGMFINGVKMQVWIPKISPGQAFSIFDLVIKVKKKKNNNNKELTFKADVPVGLLFCDLLICGK